MPSPPSNSHSRGRGPKPLGDILGELFAARGLGRIRAAMHLEDAWNAAVGEPSCRQTKVGEVRRGVLNVTVAHSALLEDLVAFRKPAILRALRENAPDVTILDIRFRVGKIEAEPEPVPDVPRPEKPPAPPVPKRSPRRPRGKG